MAQTSTAFMGTTVTNMINKIMGSSAANAVFESVSIYNPLHEETQAWTLLTSIHSDLLIPIAGVLICLYFILDLTDKVTTNGFTYEILIRSLLKLVFGTMLATHAADLCLYLLKLADKFGSEVYASISSVEVSQTVVTAGQYEASGVVKNIILVVYLLLPFLASILIDCLIYMYSWTRIFTFMTYALFSPIGLSNVTSGGIVNSPGMRYFKKMLSIALQGGIMIAIAYVAAMIEVAILPSVSIGNLLENIVALIGNFFLYIFYRGAVFMAIVKSGQIADSIVGA